MGIFQTMDAIANSIDTVSHAADEFKAGMPVQVNTRVHSLSSGANKSTYFFPILMSTNVSADTMAMVAKNLEGSYMSFVQACFQMIPAMNIDGDAINIEDYLRRFHQNIGLNNTDDIVLSMREAYEPYDLLVNDTLNEANGTNVSSILSRNRNSNSFGNATRTTTTNITPDSTEERVIKSNTVRAPQIRHDRNGNVLPDGLPQGIGEQPRSIPGSRDRWYRVIRRYTDANGNEFEERMVYTPNRLTNGQIDTHSPYTVNPRQPIEYQTVQIRTVGSTNTTTMEPRFNQVDISREVRNFNEFRPSIVPVTVTFIMNKNVPVRTTINVGVKAVLHSVGSSDLIDHMIESLSNKGFIHNFVRYTSGELHSIADIIFGIKGIKNRVAKSSEISKWAEAMERRRNSNSIRDKIPFLAKKPYLPNTAIVISAEDAAYINRQIGVDIIHDTKKATKFMKDNFLLTLVVVDDPAETIYVMHDGSAYFSEFPYASVESENRRQANITEALIKSMAQSRI